jgi:ATP-dependent protease ClpP protease subunit
MIAASGTLTPRLVTSADVHHTAITVERLERALAVAAYRTIAGASMFMGVRGGCAAFVALKKNNPEILRELVTRTSTLAFVLVISVFFSTHAQAQASIQQKTQTELNSAARSKHDAPIGVSGDIACNEMGAVGLSITINGEITMKTAQDVGKLFTAFHAAQQGNKRSCTHNSSGDDDLSAFGTHFGIDSNGGDVSAAMAIGRLFRKENAWIGVNGVCFSACVFILAGAVDRQIGKSDQVGIHRPYLLSTPDSPVEADQVKQTYSRMLQDMRSYLREMNVSPRLADDMLATEPENNHILTEAELKTYRLTGVDPAERQRRAIQKEAADVQEANELGLDRREYTRRKSLGGILCDNLSTGDYSAFIECKRSILKHGNF